MKPLSIGQPLITVKDKPEGCVLFIRDRFIYLIINFDNPTSQELGQLEKSADFEIRWIVIDGIIMIAVKVGEMDWMDMPYSPQLEIAAGNLDIDKLVPPLPVLVVMTDLSTTIVEGMRAVITNNDFSSGLIAAINDVKDNPLSPQELNNCVNSINERYSTMDLVSMGAENNFKLSDFITNTPLRKSLIEFAALVSKKPCAELEIPQELEDYHYYIDDRGHCIMCIPQIILGKAQQENNLDGFEIPVPAKYVLEKGHYFVDDYVIVDIPFDNFAGHNLGKGYTIL
ncbi:MAG: hypothetical protein FWD21_00995 [Peptococcaceae bacterium]|nr:hypothetical protein [Peptococcaceae bacterium]